MNRLPVDGILNKKKGICVVSCFHICRCATNKLEHLFLHCSYATTTWDFVGSCFELKVQNSCSILHLFLSATRVALSVELFNL